MSANVELKASQFWAPARIFPVEESKIAVEHRDFPKHWARIGGMDFGWDHPFAAVELVHDRDTDTVYVARCHRLKEVNANRARRRPPSLGQKSQLGVAA